MGRSPEARKLLRDLGKELQKASETVGRQVVWTASESLVLGQISAILDRKHEFLGAYQASSDLDERLKLSVEMRLLEQAAARMVKTISTSAPAQKPQSRRSQKASMAANARWDGEDASVR